MIGAAMGVSMAMAAPTSAATTLLQTDRDEAGKMADRTGPSAPVTPSRGEDSSPLRTSRIESDDELVPLNFENRSLADFIPIIVQYTGKAVITRNQTSINAKISIVSDRQVTKHEAIDMIFQAFRLNSIGVVETDDLIMIDNLQTGGGLNNLQPGVILGPEVDVSSLPEDGQIVTKVFRLEHAKAGDVESQIADTKPDYARVSFDVNSNQIVTEGDVAWVKRVQGLLDILDVPPYLAVQTETFRLAYADAQTIADIVLELFSPSPNASSGRTTNRAQVNRGRGAQNTAPTDPNPVGLSEQLQVSVLPQTNSVTVRAEPDILRDISYLIDTAWDVPPSRQGNIFRLYDLRYTDPVKVKNLLVALLETGGGGGASSRPAGRTGGGGGGNSGADAAVADIFRIEAYPDSNRLIVISKTPDNFDWLDGMISQIDQPLSVGMPVNVELKHASAIDVADILNTLLSQGGGGGRGIRLPEEGLSGIDFASAGGGESGGGSDNAGGSEDITFPWQSGRGANADEAAEVSALVGKSRVVPNPGQNSLLVLATPEIQDALLEIIEDLDRPGRQVMITATLAEVTLGDALNLGVRVGTNIGGEGDGIIAGSVGFDLTKGQREIENDLNVGSGGNFASPWFDTSFLDVGTNVGFVLEAIQKDNDVRILQRPRVFTSDNREAKFFAGQDVTFQTGSTANENGTTTSFEQQAIGIGLNVRPRITKERNVAMEVEILLSNLTGSTENENPVVSRRQTTTAVTVKNNQTIVISGIRREDDSDTVRKVPLLGDIPLLGALFTSTEKTKSLVELVIFITPIVVDNPDENDTNFNAKDLQRLEDLSKPLEEMSKELGNRKFFDQIDDPEDPAEDQKTGDESNKSNDG